MKTINKMTLLGNIGTKRMRTTESGIPICDLKVATHTFYKNSEGQWKNKTEWHTVILWGKLAEEAEKKAKAGALILVEGTIQYRRVDDGAERPELVANETRYLKTKVA